MKLPSFSNLYTMEQDFLKLCGDAGVYGCVIPNSKATKDAKNLEAMGLLRRETRHAFTITPRGAKVLNSSNRS